MSTPPSAPLGSVGPSQTADAASIRHIKALFQRKMHERAVALADARWPGSGQMVTLAAEWSSLSPADRRARLSQIGPEDLARLRALADLNPDLARVLDDLEARGVLPPALFAPEAGVSTEEALADTALNLGEEAASEAIVRAADPATAAAVVAAAAVTAQAARHFELLPQVEMPDLDLGLPSTDEFLDAETERRAAATAAAHAVLDRVRQRVDRNAARLLQPRDEVSLPVADTLETEPTAPVDIVEEPVAPDASSSPPAVGVTTSVVHELVERFRSSQVIVVDETEPMPSEAEIASVARTLALPLAQFTLVAGDSRAAFGGLRRRGPEVRIEAGPLARAMAGGNLVVVHGSVYPKMVARWREGFCDIPGTKASTRVAPDCRILVVAG